MSSAAAGDQTQQGTCRYTAAPRAPEQTGEVGGWQLQKC